MSKRLFNWIGGWDYMNGVDITVLASTSDEARAKVRERVFPRLIFEMHRELMRNCFVSAGAYYRELECVATLLHEEPVRLQNMRYNRIAGV